MKILVIGGNRFMGYFLVKALVKNKHHVAVLNRGNQQNAQGAEHIECDRDNKQQFASELSKREFDIVFDNCGYKPEQVRHAIALLSGKIKQYVFISSIAVYDQKNQMPCTEDSKRGGKNAFGNYGLDKSKCEDALFESVKSGFPATILRPTYVYGPKDYTDRMSRLIKDNLAGNKIRIPKTNPKTQFVYVHDVVNALLATINNQKALGSAYNITGDETINYGELVELIGEMTGKQPNAAFTLTPDFPYEDWTTYCDNSKSKKDLKIKYTPLKEGLAETFESLQ